jgi:glycosyltransferase involved in cell wall biosynthesis
MIPRILLIAYACEPETGSESGAGWIWSRMLATFAEVSVVTRENNRDAIEAHLADVPERSRLKFVYVDLPPKARFWKRGGRGARLYYMLWQRRVVRTARRLHADRPFDLVWHLTMSTVWLGSLGPGIGRPFVFGPVGGGVRTPWSLASTLGARGMLHDVARAATTTAARVANPVARTAWRSADLILVQNPETRDWLPRDVRARVEVFPHVVLDEAAFSIAAEQREREAVEERLALFAGRLLPYKGGALAIRAVANLPGWRLIVCGAGPDLDRLRRIAARRGVSDRVEFRGSVPRPKLLELMERADVFLFPSLHDEGGWVVAEAIARRLPVVCLDRGGPALLAGSGVTVSTPARTARALATAVERASEHASTPLAPTFADATRRIMYVLEGRGLIR